MITKKNIPIWSPQSPNRYHNSYQKIIDNFARCCGDSDVLFIDSTYMSGKDVVQIASRWNRSIVFNLVDPPYTWHYLRELLGNINCIMVGTDAPDIATHFWLVHAYLEFPQYSTEELLPAEMKTYLSYNYKPHAHRVALNEMLSSMDLCSTGTITTDADQPLENPGREVGLGDIGLWKAHFLNIVNETVFRQYPELIVSEKMFKPLMGLRPFVINGSPRYYDILEGWGIDFFEDLWPISDMRQPADSLETLMHRNHSIICDIINSLRSQDLQSLYRSLLPRLERNRHLSQRLMLAEYQRLCVDDIDLNWCPR